MTATATRAIRNAIVAAIETDAALLVLLAGDRVYLRQAPANAPLPYIVLAAAGERDASRYGQPGHEGDESPRCWGETLWQADAVWEALYPVLHNRRLTVAGHTMVRGKLTRLTDLPDPDRTAWQIVTQYRPVTREAA